MKTKISIPFAEKIQLPNRRYVAMTMLLPLLVAVVVVMMMKTMMMTMTTTAMI